MKKKTKLSRELVGIWESCDPLQSDVQHRISISEGKYKVAAVDIEDGERAEVYDVKWNGTHLRYCIHWPSTGRFSKNSLTLLADGKVGLTCTYSDQEILQKHSKKRVNKKKTRQS